MITPQELLDWKEHPTTCKVMQLVRKRREDLKDYLADGNLSLEDYKRVAGICEGYRDVLDVAYDYFVQEELTQEEVNDVNSDTGLEA